jgi:hypothetical protein
MMNTGAVGDEQLAGRAERRRTTRCRRAIAATAIGAIAVLASGCAAQAPLVRLPPSPPAAAPGEKQLTIWLTGYSWQDNTPPGSSAVGEPVLHTEAGGQGTFADPITVAVPGLQGATSWPPGTKFYLSTVQRYVIVEDSGASPPPPTAETHLDMWVDGRDGTKDTTDACEDQFTGNVPAQVNPPDNLPVMAGPIFANGKCNIPQQPDDLGTYEGSGGHQPVPHNNPDGGN